MATGSLILGKLSGSIGDVTAQSRGGKQVARRRVREVSNPQTDAQTLNRIITGTVGAAYSRMKEICDHSFQGLSSKSENMQKFLSANQNALRTSLIAGGQSLLAGNYLAIGKSGLIPNPYIVSRGTLPTIPFMYVKDDDEWKPTIILPVNLQSAPTYQQMCDFFGLKRGDQLTFVWIEGPEYPNGSDDDALYGVNNLFCYSRIILDPVDSVSGEKAPMSTELWNNEGLVNKPSPRNSGVVLKFINQTLTKIGFYPANYEMWIDRPCLAFAIIVSRVDNGNWMRSQATMKVNEDCLGIPSMMRAISDSYPSTSDLLDPSKFLNASPKN